MRSFLIRLSIPLFLVLLAIIAFKKGVQVAYRPELHEQPIGILIFHIISFFTFGAKDYGPPVAGPIFWQYVLYFVYYAAPLNFLSVIAETIYLLSKPLLPLLLYKKKHYLIVGYGRVGRAAADFISAKDKNARVVILDRNESELPSGLNLLRWKLLFLKRDMNDPDPLQGLRLEHCKGVFILTDNEWLNIKLYYDIRSKIGQGNENTKIFTRISSVDLISHLNDKKRNPASPSCHHFFNIHAAAGKQLFDPNINKILEAEYGIFDKWRRKGLESVIFFGFGRFGSEF